VILPAVDEDAQRGVDFVQIALCGDHARAHPLPGVDERSRHQLVGAHARDVGGREGRRQRGDGIGGKPVIAELERAVAGERDIGEAERRLRPGERHEALDACPAEKSGSARRAWGRRSEAVRRAAGQD